MLSKTNFPLIKSESKIILSKMFEISKSKINVYLENFRTSINNDH